MPQPASPSSADHQSLRIKRFLLASRTYAFGLALMGLCCALGLFPWRGLLLLALAFALANIGFYAVLRLGLNRRFADPSLTMAQVMTGATMIVLILLQGPLVHFIAVPFYSVLFVFAMLKLGRRELLIFEAFVLCTYAGAIAARGWLYHGQLDLRIEAISAVLVVACTTWFAVAASYISGLRKRLGESVRAIEQQALRDGLTGLWNRRQIDRLLAEEMKRQARSGLPLCACMLDVDHFKAINDRFGHPVGDIVLREIATALQSHLRAGDQVGRFGGEEFMVLLPATTLAEGSACAARLRGAIAALAGLPAGVGAVSVSAGLAACADGESAERFLARADAALYRAKRAGRDRVVVDAAAPAEVAWAQPGGA